MKEDIYKRVKKVLYIILVANIIVAFLKIAIGIITKSASLLSDGIHSITDASSNIIGLIGICLADKPKDKEHPYGHNKFETLSGIFISGMLFIIGGKIVLSAMNRLRNPVIPKITILSLCVLIVTLMVNLLVSIIEYKKGKELNSLILISDSMHTRSDIYVSIGVLITLIGIKFGAPVYIDSISSLIVAGFIIHAAYGIYKKNSGVLVDRVVVDTEEIKAIVLDFEQVKDIHKIRSRGSQNNLHIDMHIMVAPDLTIKESHDMVHEIEDAIKVNLNQSAQVIAHLEPYIENQSKRI